MKAFVINLDRRPDRLAEISAELDKIGLKWERIRATDGREISLSDYCYPRLSWLYNGYIPANIGLVGCFNSHRNTWQKIIDEGLSQVLVFEDDVVSVNFDPAILQLDLTQLGLDHLRLNASNPHHGNLQKPARQKLMGRDLLDEKTAGAGAYIITRAGAEKMLRAEKYWFPPDAFEVWQELFDLKTAVLNPLMFIQRNQDSDIDVALLPQNRPPTEKQAEKRNIKRCRKRAIWLYKNLYRPLGWR